MHNLYREKEGRLKPPEPTPWYAGTLHFVFVVHDICLKELHAFMFKVSSTLNSWWKRKKMTDDPPISAMSPFSLTKVTRHLLLHWSTKMWLLWLGNSLHSRVAMDTSLRLMASGTPLIFLKSASFQAHLFVMSLTPDNSIHLCNSQKLLFKTFLWTFPTVTHILCTHFF